MNVAPTPESPSTTPAAEPKGQKTWPLRVVVPVLVGAVALIAAVALLASGLGGESGGASDPKTAVSELATAIQNKDGAAAVSLIDPEEVGPLADLYEEAREDPGTLGRIALSGGTTLSFDDLDLSEERVGSGVAKVTIDSGAFRMLITEDAPSDSESADVEERELDFSSTEGPGGSGFYVMTREVDGRWYVSPTMTALQFLVEAEGLTPPDFELSGATEVESTNAPSTPDDLLSAVIQVVNSRDVAQGLELVSTGESNVVRPYTAALQEFFSRIDGSMELQVTDSDFAEQELGSDLVRLDLVHVAVDAYIVSDYESEQASVKLNGLCFNVVSTGGSSSDCEDEARDLFGVNELFVVAKREDGGMRLAPVATALEYIRLLSEQEL
ncbi:MAG: hypothetical protein WD827_06285 [Solirubrobacterales bacterium]